MILLQQAALVSEMPMEADTFPYVVCCAIVRQALVSEMPMGVDIFLWHVLCFVPV